MRQSKRKFQIFLAEYEKINCVYNIHIINVLVFVSLKKIVEKRMFFKKYLQMLLYVKNSLYL
jgi:hypothetical protein